ncbi:sulfotransferase [Dyella sp. AD56]|uniref:sulfotransferase family protein n=1 Tax=Dyella sp. AD56 TaxID=1528744 RepID=UPI000C83FB0B|nr:sulfotransferase [Dyella sp. AD56]
MQRTFIVGCPRSGTTVVQAMLARHPEVFTLPETAFFQRLLGDINHRLLGDPHAHSATKSAARSWEALRRRLGLTSREGRREFVMLQQTLLGAEYRGSRSPWFQDACVIRFIGILDELAKRDGRSAWLEKTPHHLLYLGEIEHYLPNAKVIHVIRPGIDVLASINDAYFRYQIEAFSGSLMQWVRRWNQAAEIHRSRIRHANHLLVFHEDLISSPATEWARLCRFTELTPHADIDEICHQNIADLNSEPWKRDALAGLPQQVDRKVVNQFGPQLRSWLRERLSSYEDLYAESHVIRDAEQAPARPTSMSEEAIL